MFANFFFVSSFVMTGFSAALCQTRESTATKHNELHSDHCQGEKQSCGYESNSLPFDLFPFKVVQVQHSSAKMQLSHRKIPIILLIFRWQFVSSLLLFYFQNQI